MRDSHIFLLRFEVIRIQIFFFFFFWLGMPNPSLFWTTRWSPHIVVGFLGYIKGGNWPRQTKPCVQYRIAVSIDFLLVFLFISFVMLVPDTLGVSSCWIIYFEENLVHIILILPMFQIVSLPTWIVSASANLFLQSLRVSICYAATMISYCNWTRNVIFWNDQRLCLYSVELLIKRRNLWLYEDSSTYRC